MAANSSEIQVTPPNVLGDHEARPEEANPEATGGNECLKGMELDVYNAAKQGNIDALPINLHQILTPTGNTILHIYIACATSTNPEEQRSSAINVERILRRCPQPSRPQLLLQSNKIGDTALHIAARYGRTAIVDMIKEHGETAWPTIISKRNKEGNTALHEAVRFNHLDVVMKMLTTQDDRQGTFNLANESNDAGETPLYMAAERGYRDVVFQILDSCTDPAYQGPNGRTALHAAVIRNDKEMTEMLLYLTKAVDEDGCTPLHLAASLGHTSIVELLLEYDRSAAYVKDKCENRTPLHFAASKGHLDVMKQLILQCPDCCELVDKKSRNFLHCGILADEEFSVVNFVLEDPWLSNILLNGKDDNGDTPLHYLADTSCFRPFCSALATDARVDKMAFNKANQNAFDILLQIKGDSYFSTTQNQLKDKLRRNGVISGCRNVRDKEEVPVENKQKEKSSEDEYSKKVKGDHLIVATLIATVSFAAGFTMPGGYQSDKGPDQGFAILARNAAFQAFVVTNTIAMTLSSCSVLLHLYNLAFIKRRVMSEAYLCLYAFTMLAMIAMVIAFITGTYAVLGHSSWIGITVCVLGFILFFVLVEFMIYDQRGITENPIGLLPLSLSLIFFFWLGLKMFYGIRKFCYKCLRLVSHASKGKRSKPTVAPLSTPLLGDESDRQMNVDNRC